MKEEPTTRLIFGAGAEERHSPVGCDHIVETQTTRSNIRVNPAVAVCIGEDIRSWIARRSGVDSTLLSGRQRPLDQRPMTAVTAHIAEKFAVRRNTRALRNLPGQRNRLIAGKIDQKGLTRLN